jgi:septal ring factor EnvC (AmiA/AmiB activator)
MKEFLKYNFKYIIIFVGVVLVYFLLMDLMTPSNGMSKEDLKKIEQIDKDINLLIESQKKLDESINEYKKEIDKIDSTISNIKVKKEVVNNYYEQKGKEIKDANVKQVDSLLRSRYKF